MTPGRGNQGTSPRVKSDARSSCELLHMTQEKTCALTRPFPKEATHLVACHFRAGLDADLIPHGPVQSHGNVNLTPAHYTCTLHHGHTARSTHGHPSCMRAYVVNARERSTRACACVSEGA